MAWRQSSFWSPRDVEIAVANTAENAVSAPMLVCRCAFVYYLCVRLQVLATKWSGTEAEMHSLSSE